MTEDERDAKTSSTAIDTTTDSTAMNVDTPEAEAGPSRIRRSSNEPMNTSNTHADADPPRPASPSTALPRTTSTNDRDVSEQNGLAIDSNETPSQAEAPPGRTIPHLDLATFPTQQLLRMLASLLQQIASANDQLRPDSTGEDQEEGGTGEGDDTEHDRQSTSSGTRSRAESGASTPQPPITAPTPSGPSQEALALINPELNPAHPSPTTALFTSADASATPAVKKPIIMSESSRRLSHSPTTGRAETLFTASKSSLNHRSSLLSFHARHIPSISIEAYLLRILKYCPTTNEVFLGLLVYFDRMSRLGTPGGLGGMMKGGKGFAIDSYNVHRLIIAGVTVASKFFSDVFYTNSRYAKVGGLPPHELNQLELQFLLLNDFRLAIPLDEMQRYGNRLLGYWENKEAEERNSALENGGVGLPSEDQVRQAQALAKAARENEGGDGSGKSSETHTPVPSQSHTPDKSHQLPTKFDPTNTQTTSAITTA